jgi:diguanylate cyclase (GGDEF)-like protein
MNDSTHRKPTQSAALLLGILLTLLAVVGHRFLPQRRLAIDSSQKAANFFLVQMDQRGPVKLDWIDQAHFHYACQFPREAAMQGCGFAYMLSSQEPTRGIDLSRFHTLHLAVRYTGKAQYLRVGIRNFDARFSRLEDLNSPKFNFVNIPPQDLARPISISLSEFAVAEWWTTAYNHPREYSRPDLSNATVLNIDLQGELAGTQHDIQIDQIEFVGDWISVEYWYLGILSLWMILGTVYGTSQWLRMRRNQHVQREQIKNLEHEKEKYQKLSTIDSLTNVLNRHGIDQFIAALSITRVPASIIVIDLDNFKVINDQRGHYGGDRVLRTMGDILRSHSRNTDGLGRWGGEEFVLVCPGTSLVKAVELAEKLRQKIMETDFIPDDPLPVTASFGVAASSAEQSFEDAFRQADQALYLAKSRGRNCVVAANEDQMHKATGARKGTWALISGRFKLHG